MTKCSPPPLLERLMDRVEFDPNGGCWLWSGSTVRSGYGHIGDRGKCKVVHRVMFEAVRGPIPEGLHVLHGCDVRVCVNPQHLRIGTRSDNMRDMIKRGRRQNMPPTYTRLKPPERAVIIRLYQEGHSLLSIARQVNRASFTCRAALIDAGVYVGQGRAALADGEGGKHG